MSDHETPCYLEQLQQYANTVEGKEFDNRRAERYAT
jgi:hypothetical protein